MAPGIETDSFTDQRDSLDCVLDSLDALVALWSLLLDFFRLDVIVHLRRHIVKAAVARQISSGVE